MKEHLNGSLVQFIKISTGSTTTTTFFIKRIKIVIR